MSTPIVYQRLGQAVLGIVTIADVAANDPETAQAISSLGDISAATLSASQERGLFVTYLEPGEEPSAEAQSESAVFSDQQELHVDSFLAGQTLDDRQTYANDITRNSRSTSAIRGSIAQGISVPTTKEAWYQAATVRIDALREIERQVSVGITTRAGDTSTQAWVQSAISAAAVLVVLILTLGLATYVARSIVGPLGRLREAALDTAARGLPGMVDRIRQDGPAVARSTKLAVMPEGKDEIGQVATAFNDVQQTAVEVAADQALLRQNLDTIVVNLSRRTQSLVDRQLGEIEGLEARERDPEQLSTLFRIDHMATRVRRHAESLLVLAGVEEMRKHGAATPVLDVVRTAVGEVEQYPRVRFGVMPTDLVASVGVDDVAHLLAELIDNATEFSSPSTPVSITSQPLLGGGLRIQVADVGLGVPPDQLTVLNERLSNPGDIDVAASRTLGLYVVARLANKHGIRVRLEPGQSAGIVAQVDLPAHLILSPLDTAEGAIPAVTEEVAGESADVDSEAAMAGTTSILGGNAASEEDAGLPRRSPGDVPPRGSPEAAPAGAEQSGTRSLGDAEPTPAADTASQSLWDTAGAATTEAHGRPAPGAPAQRSAAPTTDGPIPPLVAPGNNDRQAPSAPDPAPRQQRPPHMPAQRPEPSSPTPASAQWDAPSSGQPSAFSSGSGLYDGPGTQDHPVVSPSAGEPGSSPQEHQPRGQHPVADAENASQPSTGPASRSDAAPSGRPAPGRPAQGRPTEGRPADSRPADSRPPPNRPATGQPGTDRPAHVPPRPVTADAVVDESLRAPTPSLPEGEAPIYEAVRSAWFNASGPNSDFSSPADAGWQRAAEALRSAEEAASARRDQYQGSADVPGTGTGGRPRPSRRTPVSPSPAPANEPLLTGDQRHAADHGQAAPGNTERPVRPPAQQPGDQPTEQPSRQPAEQPSEPQPESPAAAWTSGGEPGPAADEPMLSSSGLPMRRRGASLVPGSIAEAGANAEQKKPEPAAAEPKDAGNVASTLSSLQRGVSRGRDESGGWVPGRPSDPERSNP